MTKFCPMCHRKISPGSLTTQIMGSEYHSSCLFCAKCGKSVWNKPFIKRQDGKLYCEDNNCESATNGPASLSEQNFLIPHQRNNNFSIYNQFQYGSHPQNAESEAKKNGQFAADHSSNENVDFSNSYQPYAKNYEPFPRNQANVPKNIHSYNLGKYLTSNGKLFEENQTTKSSSSSNSSGQSQTVSSGENLEKLKDNNNNAQAHAMVESSERPTSKRASSGAASRCSKCRLGFSGNDERFNYDNKSFHKECFTCDSCNSELYRMKKVMKYSSDDVNVNAKYYCEPCYADLYGPKCGKCHTPVNTYMLSTSYDGKLYHKECFTCSRCKLNLGANRQFSKIGNLIICKDCY
jgi:hypothetical protein